MRCWSRKDSRSALGISSRPFLLAVRKAWSRPDSTQRRTVRGWSLSRAATSRTVRNCPAKQGTSVAIPLAMARLVGPTCGPSRHFYGVASKTSVTLFRHPPRAVGVPNLAQRHQLGKSDAVTSSVTPCPGESGKRVLGHLRQVGRSTRSRSDHSADSPTTKSTWRARECA